jgi:hypothetical protein
MLNQKRLFWLLMIGGLLFVAVSVMLIHSTCQDHLFPQYWTKNQSDVTSPNNQLGKCITTRGVTSYSFDCSNISSIYTYHPQERSWLFDVFLCDMKIGDAALVYITFCLVVVGGFQAYWIASPDTERAYMSAGGVRVILLAPLPAGQFGPPTPVPAFEFHVNNHGKTPGETWEYGIGFCDINNIPPTPVYRRTYYHDWMGPGTQSRPIARIPLPPNNNTAVFGRIFYRDIFGIRRSSGFIQNIIPDQAAPLLAPQVYTDFD